MHYNTHPLVFTWIEQKKPLFVSSSLIGLLSPTLAFMSLTNTNAFPSELLGFITLASILTSIPILTKHTEHLCCKHNREKDDSSNLGIARGIFGLSLGTSTLLNAVAFGATKLIPPEISVSLAAISSGLCILSAYKISENRKSQKLEDLERQVLRV